MSTWTRYTLTFDATWSNVVVDVREPESQAMIDLFTEINEFWSGADERMSEADDDVLVAVLNMLCRNALVMELTHFIGAVHEFAVTGVEGWPLLDGSCGIKLVSVESIDFDSEISIRSEPIEVAA